MARPPSPLSEARKRLLIARIEARGGVLPLTRDHFAQLADAGLSRANVDAAVDALVEAGEATIDTEAGLGWPGGTVVVRLTGGSAE